MTVLEVQTAHRVLDEYNKNISKSIRPDRLNLPIRAGVFDVEEADMWMEAGMSFTRKRLVDACIFLTTFDLLTDEGVDYSKYGEVHIYKITKAGIIVANSAGGLEYLMLDNGNVIFIKLTQLVNHKQNSNSISNNFINSPVNQFQQVQDTSNTNLSQVDNPNNSTITRNKTVFNFESTKRKKTFKEILVKWWWAFVIPITIGIILLAIEYHWFVKS